MSPARLSAAQPCQRRLVQARRLFFGVIPFAGLVFSVVHAAAAAPAAFAGAFGIRGFRRCVAAAPQRAARHKSDEKQGKAKSAQGLNGHFPTQQKMLWPFYRREGASAQSGPTRKDRRRSMPITVSPLPAKRRFNHCQGRPKCAGCRSGVMPLRVSSACGNGAAAYLLPSRQISHASSPRQLTPTR